MTRRPMSEIWSHFLRRTGVHFAGKCSRTVTLSLALACPLGFAGGAQANPVTVEYRCTPSLPKGDVLTVDYNSGYNSVTAQFPNGQSIRMPRKRSGSGFRYGKGNLLIYGKGDTEITLEIGSDPSRRCVKQ
jgi:membrane-bound inhibitor of C-type lysozyme